MKRNNWSTILAQTFIWGFGWLIVLLILKYGESIDNRFWTKASLIVVGTSTVVLINLKWLLPNLYFKKRRGVYYLSITVLVLFTVWGIHSDSLPWNKQTKSTRDFLENGKSFEDKYDNLESKDQFVWLIRNLPPLIISLLGSSFVALGAFAKEKEMEAVLVEKSKLLTELKFLKSQINPHFLFNSLHNIYALTIIHSDLASEHLLKLSEMLRYMLYESNEESVKLDQEITYLENYLSLAQLKDSRGMDVRFDKNIHSAAIEIAPLLFIPFLENAFKHSQIEDIDEGYIYMTLSTTTEELIFEIQNSKPQRAYFKDQVGGIGLNNIKQRLLLLYPEYHTLKITNSNESFKVHLSIQF